MGGTALMDVNKHKMEAIQASSTSSSPKNDDEIEPLQVCNSGTKYL